MKITLAALVVSNLALAASGAQSRLESRVQRDSHHLQNRGLVDSLLVNVLNTASNELEDLLGAQGSNQLFTPLTSLFQKTNHQGQSPKSGGSGQVYPSDARRPSMRPPPGADTPKFRTPNDTPPPPLKATGNSKWAGAITKAQAMVAKLNSTEKVGLVTGVGWQNGQCVGNIAAIPRVGFGGLCLQDSPLGVRFADRVTVFPAGITTAATFSLDLIYKRGKAMGEEFRSKGANIQLGPGLNFLRAPAGGRSFEYAGGDPYLAGEVGFQTVDGIQSVGVQANAKHYLFNDQEHFRNEYSSNVDARTTREIYAHPFLRTIQADVASFMCSYNRVNGTWACSNAELINGLLKTEMGFQGPVISDWGAQHSGIDTANAGMDMTMPGDELCCFQGQNSTLWGGNLTTSVQNGTVASSRVDDMATRIFAAWYLLGQDDPNYPTPNFNSFNKISSDNKNIDATADHDKIAREVAAAGIVLVKNKNKALPLKKPKSIAVIGGNAGPAYNGPNFYSDHAGYDGIVAEGWGSGTADFSYLISPYEALQQRARTDRTSFTWSFNDYDLKNAKAVATVVEKAIVFIATTSGEDYLTFNGNEGDRNNLTSWHQGDALVQAVASVQKNTIVVVNGPAQVDVEAWIEHPNVTAVLFAHMGGSESGNAVRDVLYGAQNPSGRLPYTLAKKRSDYSADVLYSSSEKYMDLPYSEGLFVDYRHFDHKNITPRFEFGFGLGYSTFKYGAASGEWIGDKDFNSKWGDSQAKSGLPDWLFADTYRVNFTLTNTGKIDDFEIPQVYLGFPSSSGEPPKVLRAFDRFAVKAGATINISFTLNAYDLSTYDVTEGRWLMPSGSIDVLVGQSSRKIKSTFTI
ncbi:unnamed protein product [Tilletia controversa]|nr:unnamed protein product [Tilletia controversa]CAD6935874.1 unnamed protein product [Tilletia controversa]CAD6979671.1 unnamed protein product [Tilletia controversa]